MGRRLIGIRRALLHERGQGTNVRSCQERLGAEAQRSQVSWTARTDGCLDWYHHRLWKAWASIARSRTLGSDRLARSQRSAVGLATNRCVPEHEVDVEAQPGAAEAEQRERAKVTKQAQREREQCHQDRKNEGALHPRGAQERKNQIRGISSSNSIRDRCSRCWVHPQPREKKGHELQDEFEERSIS